MITAAQLNRIFNYDPKTGVLVWAQGRGGKNKGDVAGGISRGSPVVSIDGNNYPVKDIIWQMVKGRKAPKRIRLINGNNKDLRWKNLTVFKKKTGLARVDVGIERTPYGIRLISLQEGDTVDLGTYKDLEQAIDVLRIVL